MAAKITVRALVGGTGGNAVALSESSAAMSVSGATLSGGVDEPVGALSYEQGISTFETSADGWQSGVDVLEALHEAERSEVGFLFSQRDDVLTFVNRHKFFKPATSVINLNVNPFWLKVERDSDRVRNFVQVRSYPRVRDSVVQRLVVAPAMLVPPADPKGPGRIVPVFSFRDAYSNPVGGYDLVLPLVPNTDYKFNEHLLGLGTDHTLDGVIRFGAVDVRGASIKLEILNFWGVPIYVTLLQVRGKAIYSGAQAVATREDVTSQDSYGLRELGLDLTLSNDVVYAESLARYLINMLKDPQTAVISVRFENTPVVSGVNVFSIKLLDVLALTDKQTGLVAVEAFVVGREFGGSPEGWVLTLYLVRRDSRKFWVLGVPGYSELGVTTRPAP